MKNEKQIKKIFTQNILFLLIIPLLIVIMLILILTGYNYQRAVLSHYTTLFSLLSSQVDFQLQGIERKVLSYKELWGDILPVSGEGSNIIRMLLAADATLLKVQVENSGGELRAFFPPGREAEFGIIPEYSAPPDTFSPMEYFWCGGGFLHELDRYIIKIALVTDSFVISFYYDFSVFLNFIHAGPVDSFLILDQPGTLLTNLPDFWAEIVTSSRLNQLHKIPHGNVLVRKQVVNEEKYWLYSEILESTGWILLSLQHEASEDYFLSGQIIVLLFFLILIFLIAIIYSMRITRPILTGLRNLIENTRQVASGNYELIISGGGYAEMSALACQFNLMVSSIRQRETKLRESEEQIRKILEASPDAITVTDLNGKIINCNRAAAVMYGFFDKAEIFGVNAFQLIVYEYLEKAKDILVKTLNEGSTYNVEYTFLKKNGEKFYGEVSCSAIMNVSNDPVAFVSVTKDITSRKKIEDENQKIIHNLELKQAELERFTYTVSHDLRSPLITIKGFLGFLEEDLEVRNTKQLKDDIQKISNAVDKMNNLLNDLLELSRIGRLSNEMESISLELIVQEVLEMLAGLLKLKGIEIHIMPGLPEVYGNYKRLVELYQNLVENAIKYMGDQEHPLIKLGFKQTKFETIFFVQDNGIGIDPRYHEKIFGLFDQLDQQSEGTGIGLALVKRIVETHGGKIWVESEGKVTGTVFHFTLG